MTDTPPPARDVVDVVDEAKAWLSDQRRNMPPGWKRKDRLDEIVGTLVLMVQRLRDRDFEMHRQFDEKLGDLAQENAEIRSAYATLREAAIRVLNETRIHADAVCLDTLVNLEHAVYCEYPRCTHPIHAALSPRASGPEEEPQ
jgi:hypothetical protein